LKKNEWRYGEVITVFTDFSLFRLFNSAKLFFVTSCIYLPLTFFEFVILSEINLISQFDLNLLKTLLFHCNRCYDHLKTEIQENQLRNYHLLNVIHKSHSQLSSQSCFIFYTIAFFSNATLFIVSRFKKSLSGLEIPFL